MKVPVLESKRLARGLIALLVLLLVLPVVVRALGLPSREEAYLTISDNYGPVGSVVENLFHDPTDADVLFIGSSPTTYGIIPSQFEEGLSRRMGRPVTVRVLSMGWGVEDLQYFMLRDYLEHHKPRLVVVEAPYALHLRNNPHGGMYMWLRFGEYDDALSTLPLANRAEVYAQQVLGAPRQLLNALRNNKPAANEHGGQDYDAFLKQHDWLPGRDGVPNLDGVPHPDFPPFKFDSPIVKSVERHDNTYAAHFIHLIGELKAKYGLHLVLAHFPTEDEFGKDFVPSYADLDALLGFDCEMIGPPTGQLFAGVDRAAFNKCFISDGIHLNQTGAVFYDHALESPIAQLLGESSPPSSHHP